MVSRNGWIPFVDAVPGLRVCELWLVTVPVGHAIGEPAWIVESLCSGRVLSIVRHGQLEESVDVAENAMEGTQK